MKKIYCLIFAFIMFSCENNQIDFDQDNLLLGHWINPTYKNDITTFTRGNSLPNNNYGITFKSNGQFIEKTSGWCGTPPLSYFNVEGNFSLENKIINISNAYKPHSFGWRILKLTDTKLVVKREYTEQEKEHRVLMNLFHEIENLAYSKSCIDSSNWAFVAYGAKACGGPQGYIPYSKEIDTVSFLQKIENYTNAEKAYNIKWGIVSNCTITNVPKTVNCLNQNPTLIY